MFNEWVEWLQQVLHINSESQIKILITAGILVLLYVLRQTLLAVVFRHQKNLKVQYHWRKTSTYLTFLIGLLILIQIWFEGLASLATYLGLLSAGIAIALRDPLVNLAGWAFLVWRRPFVVGDRIEIAGVAGDVIDIRIFQFTLVEIGNWVDADQSTGRIIHIPNGQVFIHTQANYTMGFGYIWNEVPVRITFESNWRKAKKILQDIAETRTEHLSKPAEEKIRQASQKYMIFYSKLTPIVYTTVKDFGVVLTLRFLCDPRKRRGTEEVIWEEILEKFQQASDIGFAYPTTRFFNNLKEGSPGSGPENPALNQDQ